MSQIEINYNPPRQVLAPLTPLPQTCMGVLEHSGLPMSEPSNVTDIPPDFDWMTTMQVFIGTFNYSKNDAIGKQLGKYSVIAPDVKQAMVLEDNTPLWCYIPFATSKWWTGIVSFKFIALKPPRVTGKLAIRYSFLPLTAESNDAFGTDTQYRGIIKEWDLGQSNIFEMDIVSVNPMQVRPTWLPENRYTLDGISSKRITTQMLSPVITQMGHIQISPAQRLQPGSIFPDSIRILIFRSFKNTQFFTPTDARSRMKHILTTPVCTVPLSDAELRP